MLQRTQTAEICALFLALSVALAGVALVACTSSTSGGSSNGSNGLSCVQQGGVFSCGGDSKNGVPVCGATSGSCDLSADSGCGSCREGAGLTCSCRPGDGGAGEWLCLGTGGPCEVK